MSERQLTLAFCLMEYFPFGGQQRDFRKIADHCVEQGHRVIALVNVWRDELPATFEVVQFGIRAGSNHRRLKNLPIRLPTGGTPIRLRPWSAF